MKRFGSHGGLSGFLLAALLVSGFGCSTVPITGRRQLSLISAGEEAKLGLSSFEQTKKEVPLSQNAAARALVEKVGRRIAEVASGDLPGAQWEFVVFESKEMNAFCLPGGKVGVYSGILAVTRDETGLATVLGHEVAHAVARHGGERMSREMARQAVGQVLSTGAAVYGASAQAQMIASQAFGMGSKLAVALPHDRFQEAEADRMGLVYMARAGYDPKAAVAFWERFAQATAGGDQTPWFLRTHPVTQDRINDIRKAMPAAEAEYQRSRAAGTP